jgi:hypothetical protein
MGLGGLARGRGEATDQPVSRRPRQQRYATTGGQAAVSRQVDLAAVATGAGYPWARRCRAGADANAAVGDWLAASGPAFLLLEIEAGDPQPAPRIPMTPVEMGERFRAALVPATR